MSGGAVAASVLDAGEMAALHARAFPAAERWGAATFATQLVLPGVFGWIAPGVGFVLARVAADEAEILTLAVDPDARRGGIGRALLEAAEAGAVARGARRMFLEVAPGNLAARALYAAAGYAEAGRRKRYYPDGSDALVLSRRLSRAGATAG